MTADDRFLFRQVKARPLTSFAAAFLLGLWAGTRLAVSVWICALGLAAPLCGLFLLRGRRRAVAVSILLAGIACGMLRMSLATAAIPQVETRYSVEMTGRVVSEPFKNPTTGRMICKFRLEEINGEPSKLPVRLYLRGDEADLEAVAYGQRLSLVSHLWACDAVTNPYQFDFGAYLNREGLCAYATAKIEDVAVLDTIHDVRTAMIAARRAISGRIDALFADNAGLMRALVLGDRSLLGEELRESLNRSGTAHLISISGLHVTVLSALLAFLLSRFMPRRRANLIAAALLVPYGAMIGFSAPFVRALVMFAIICFAPIAGYPSDPITRLSVALLGYLLASPLSIEDAGFALSFAASAGIILLMPPLARLLGVDRLRLRRPASRRWQRMPRRLALYLFELLCASLAAQLATLPFVVLFFGVQSLVSLPFNLICVPLCMLGYITGLIALILSAVSLPLAALLARVPDGLFTLLVRVAQFSGRLPVSVVRIGRYPFALILLHWGIVLAASELSGIGIRWRRFMPFALLIVAGLSSLLVFARAWNFSVVFLDAGQADCAIVTTRGHTYMIDAGDTYTPAADYLNATCLHLDGVLLSHPHQDHAGGLTDVLTSYRPDAIYVPAGWFDQEGVSPAVTEGIDTAREMGVEILELSAGDTLSLSKVARLDVYSPDADNQPGDANDLSLLALITCEDQRVLFTGDLSADGEPEVIPDADVLKVAHHGSAKASSERFLSACTPEIAVISVGENNYGHPAPETLEKLTSAGARVYMTRESGAITLTHRQGGWHIQTYLEASHALE